MGILTLDGDLHLHIACTSTKKFLILKAIGLGAGSGDKDMSDVISEIDQELDYFFDKQEQEEKEARQHSAERIKIIEQLKKDGIIIKHD